MTFFRSEIGNGLLKVSKRASAAGQALKKDNNQSRRLLSLAAVLDGMNRTDAARIDRMDRWMDR
jgi:hypothetical protein